MSPVLEQAAAGAVVVPLVFAAVLGPMYVCHRLKARAPARGPSRLGGAVLAGLGWTLGLLAILGEMLARLVGLAVLVAAVVAVLVAVALAPAPSVSTMLMAVIVVLALR